MIVGIQSLTLKCITRVLSLKVFLQFVGNVGLYSVGKEMRKTHFKKGSGSEFRGSLTTWPKSRSDLRNTAWQKTVQIPS